MNTRFAQSRDQWTCKYLEGGLVFYGTQLKACCVRHHDNLGHVVLIDRFDPADLSVDQIVEGRERIFAKLRQPGGYERCNGCIMLRKGKPHAEKSRIDYLNFAHIRSCNLICTYCATKLDTIDGSAPAPKLLPTVKRMHSEGLLEPDLFVEWSGGEPTLSEEFGDMSSFLAGLGVRQSVFTNGTILSDDALKWIPKNLERMYISVDAGTAETYQRIKGVDAFERVWKNIAAYVQKGGGRILPKMILLRENLGEVTQFVQRADQARAQRVVVDLDFQDQGPTAEKVEAAAVMLEECARRGIRLIVGFFTLHAQPEYLFGQKVLHRFRERLKSRPLGDRFIQSLGRATAVRHAVRLTRRALVRS